MNTIITGITMAIYGILGAMFISLGFNNFKEKHYFSFGLDVFGVIIQILYLIKTIFM